LVFQRVIRPKECLVLVTVMVMVMVMVRVNVMVMVIVIVTVNIKVRTSDRHLWRSSAQNVLLLLSI